jgi:TRAP-type uncharacterized transport system substrate-binding protein
MSDTLVIIQPQIQILTAFSPGTVTIAQALNTLSNNGQQVMVSVQQSAQTIINIQQMVVLEKQDNVQIITMGTQGPSGQSLPIGGTIHQVLKKNSAINFDYAWSRSPISQPTHMLWGHK